MKKFFTLTDAIVPLHHPRVLIETAVSQGADRNALLLGTDITPSMLENPDARISYAQFAILINNALMLTRNPALGVDFGRQIHLSQLGILGLALMSASDLRSALEVALRYYRTLAPLWDLSIQIDGDRALLLARETIPLKPFDVFATESLLTGFEAQAVLLHGGPLPDLEVTVPYPEPAHSARYTEIHAVRIRYNQPAIQILFDQKILDQPIATADPLTARLAERHCARVLAAGTPVDGLVGQVRGLLNAQPGNYLDLLQISKLLQTSTRSLRRGLQAMGTSYQKLLDDVRRDHAIELASGTAMTAEQMARHLGFSDVRSFRRAFVRWTGSTPNGYRERRGQ